MKAETIIPEEDRKLIEEYQAKIQERIESYFDDTKNRSVCLDCVEIEKIIRRIKRT